VFAAGLAVALVVLFVRTHDPGRGRGTEGTLRGDLDRAEARILEESARSAQHDAAILARVAALEAAVSSLPESPARTAVAEALAALAEDLRTLGESVRGDLEAAELRIATLERRLDEAASLLPPPGAAGSAAAAEDEEAVWLNLAHDADPLRRFSALERLGRARSDRSVRVSIEALRDPSRLVVWQALRNLGNFAERPAARDVAELLDHAEVDVRNAAWESLVRMGAPESGFRASEKAEMRREPAARLKAWAAEQ